MGSPGWSKPTMWARRILLFLPRKWAGQVTGGHIMRHPPAHGFEDGLSGSVWLEMRIISRRMSRTAPSRAQLSRFPKVLTAFFLELAGVWEIPLCLKSLSPHVRSQAANQVMEITLPWKPTSRKPQLFAPSPFPQWRQLFINFGNMNELLVTDLTSSSCCSWDCLKKRVHPSVRTLKLSRAWCPYTQKSQP